MDGGRKADIRDIVRKVQFDIWHRERGLDGSVLALIFERNNQIQREVKWNFVLQAIQLTWAAPRIGSASAPKPHASYAKLCCLDRLIDRLSYNGNFFVALLCCASAFLRLPDFT